jgi:glycosyltransferase involved in cell wall biosynthesis
VSAASAAQAPRVLAVSAIGGMGGPVVSLLSMLRASRSMSYVVAGPFSDAVAAHLRACPSVTDVRWLPRRPRHTLLRLPWLVIRVLALAGRRPRPDVLLANGLTEAAICVVAALVHRRPLVVWVHNFELPLAARVMRPLLRSRLVGTRWMAVSALAGRVSAPVRGRRPYALVLNPVDEDAVRSARGQVETSSLRVGYLGSARPYKGFDLLPAIIDATAAATSRSVEWYVFTGKGWAPDIDAELDARPQVHRVGPVYPQSAAYGCVDAVLCPSRQESFGRVVAEAMYNGLPVVASRIPAFEELLAHRPEESLFPLEDVAAAGRLVAALAEDPELRRSIGTRNADVGRRFTTDRVLPEFEAVLACRPRA